MLSVLLFTWCDGLFSKGNAVDGLRLSDLWPLDRQYSCKFNTDAIFEKGNVARNIWRMFGMRLIGIGWLLPAGYCGMLITPLVMKNILSIIETNGNMQHLWFYIFALCGTKLVSAVFKSQFGLRANVISMQLLASMRGYLYRKVLCLHPSVLNDLSVGDFVNLYVNDVVNIATGTLFIHLTWLVPLQLVVIIRMLFMLLGKAVFASIVTVFGLFVLSAVLAKVDTTYFRNVMQLKDQRMDRVKDLFAAIGQVKLNGWADTLAQNLKTSRKEEVQGIWKHLIVNSFTVSVAFASPIVVSTVTLGVYVFVLNQTLTAATAFTAISTFTLLLQPLGVLPVMVAFLVQARVSYYRLLAFAELEETLLIKGNMQNMDDGCIQLSDASFSWKPQDAPLFENISMNIEKGSFVVVHGPIGVGKTAFCNALLGNMYCNAGKVSMGGKVAYCAQCPWIQNSTIRENILFGLPYSAVKYEKVLRICQLTQDIQEFERQGKSMAGENGQFLSGGQKARVALARALYYDADIYIFDSILAALDYKVQSQVYMNLRDYLRHRTVIYVTQSETIVKSNSVDILVAIDKDRKIQVHYNTHAKTFNDSEFAENYEDIALELAAAKCVEVDELNEVDENLSLDTENRQVGAVTWKVYASYIGASGGIRACIWIVVLQCVWQALTIASGLWLNKWTTESSELQATDLSWNVFIYFGLSFGGLFVSLLKTLAISWFGLVGAKSLFDNMTSSLVSAPMSFFDKNPVGRLLNRYSVDFYTLDFTLSVTLGLVLGAMFSILGAICTTVGITRVVSLLIVPAGFLYYQFGKYYLKTARDVQRLNKVAASPVLSLASETLQGLQTIRAFNRMDYFLQRNEKLNDDYNRTYFPNFIIGLWFSIRLEIVGSIVVFLIISMVTVLGSLSLSAGLVGIIFNYALELDGNIQMLITSWPSMEMQMVSPERMSEYTQIEPEGQYSTKVPHVSWPSRGIIEFKHVHFQYETQKVLHDISFQIKSNEHVCIVGRTGAGKSSIAMALFRRNALSGGTIYIDNQDISLFQPDLYRRRLCIISQEPTLLRGTLRYFLDSTNQASDSSIWSALQAVCMKSRIGALPNKLDTEIANNSAIFSAGERQLLCMARALVQQSKIIIMDEATANMDISSIERMNAILVENFRNTTVLAITHDIHSISYFDRAIILENGKLLAMDTPKALEAHSYFTT